MGDGWEQEGTDRQGRDHFWVGPYKPWASSFAVGSTAVAGRWALAEPCASSFSPPTGGAAGGAVLGLPDNDISFVYNFLKRK